LEQWTDKAPAAEYADREGELGLDIDGDGEVSRSQYVERQGNLPLKVVDGAYAVETESGDVVLTRPSGRAFGLNDNFEFTHAEPTSDGGFVAVMQFNDGQVSLRWFDAKGNLDRWTNKSPSSSYMDSEDPLNLDINGDGVIGEPEVVPFAITLDADNWSSEVNNFDFNITSSSNLIFDGLKLRSGSVAYDVSSRTVGDEVKYDITSEFSNGHESGLLELAFHVREDLIKDMTADFSGVVFNGKRYSDFEYNFSDGPKLNLSDHQNSSSDDFSDSEDNAYPLPIGDSLDGAIEFRGDSDVFRVNAIEGQRYLVSMQSSDLDNSRFSVSGPDGHIVKSAYAPHDSGVAKISFVAESAGVYSIDSHELGDDDTGEYKLKVQELNLHDDHGDYQHDATPIELGESVSGSIDAVGDDDFFQFSVAAGQRYHVGMASQQLDNPRFTIYDADG
ncbi:hypothetical protein RSO41_04520, partial [Halomonas sp. I1]|uniref:hypothetical protein n=1 Tax=Halomonas sp. I1 TaxID=393536 RepID=UPI0028DE17C9